MNRAYVSRVFVLTTILLSVTVARGQVSLIPLLQEVSVNRGGRETFDLRVANRGDSTLSFTLTAFNMNISNEGIPTIEGDETPWSCANWITFSPQQFTLVKDSVMIVKGHVAAPGGIASGGYYSFLACQFQTPRESFSFDPNQKSKVEVELGRAVSSVLLVTVRSSQNKAQLHLDSLHLASGQPASATNVALTKSPSENQNAWQITLSVTNTGNVHTIAEGRATIWSNDMRAVGRTDLKAGKGYVLPGKTRLLRGQGEAPLDDGVYLVKVDVRTREGKTVHGDFPFCIVQGTPERELDSMAVRTMLEATTPKFGIMKDLLEVVVTPGSMRTSGTQLKNYTSDTLVVASKLITWSVNDSGRIVMNPDSEALVRPCISWLTVQPNPLIIPPRGSSAVRVTVTAPAEVEGEYYGAVSFETGDSAKDLPPDLQQNRTVFVLVSSAKNLIRKAEVNVASHKTMSPLLRTFAVTVANTGNVHCFASGKLTVFDQQWKAVSEPVTFGSTQDLILPGKGRAYAVPFTGAMEPGSYSASFEVQFNDTLRGAVSEYRFRVN